MTNNTQDIHYSFYKYILTKLKELEESNMTLEDVNGFINTAKAQIEQQMASDKSELQTAINSKANSSDVYSKSQVDTKLDAKANTSNVYTKTEVDGLINGHNNTEHEVLTQLKTEGLWSE